MARSQDAISLSAVSKLNLRSEEARATSAISISSFTCGTRDRFDERASIPRFARACATTAPCLNLARNRPRSIDRSICRELRVGRMHARKLFSPRNRRLRQLSAARASSTRVLLFSWKVPFGICVAEEYAYSSNRLLRRAVARTICIARARARYRSLLFVFFPPLKIARRKERERESLPIGF